MHRVHFEHLGTFQTSEWNTINRPWCIGAFAQKCAIWKMHHGAFGAFWLAAPIFGMLQVCPPTGLKKICKYVWAKHFYGNFFFIYFWNNFGVAEWRKISGVGTKKMKWLSPGGSDDTWFRDVAATISSMVQNWFCTTPKYTRSRCCIDS